MCLQFTCYAIEKLILEYGEESKLRSSLSLSACLKKRLTMTNMVFWEQQRNILDCAEQNLVFLY